MSIPELRLFPQPQRQAEVIRHAPDTLDFTEAPNNLEKKHFSRLCGTLCYGMGNTIVTCFWLISSVTFSRNEYVPS